MLDLLLGHILAIVGLERHAVVTHTFQAMPAHFHVAAPADLSIQLIQSIVKW